MAKSKVEVTESKHITITAPNFGRAVFTIVGTAAMVQNNWSQKALTMMRQKQEGTLETTKGKKTVHEKKDFNECFLAARYVDRTDGWEGVPACAFRSGMIDACRLVDMKMNMAKMSVFVEADGTDLVSGKPIVRFAQGKAVYCQHPVKVGIDQADIRPRAFYDIGWKIKLRVTWDDDQFHLQDVTNLLARVGQQIGIGEGRPYSRHSAGCGWGTFAVDQAKS
jgi:hypothetical protein